MAAEDITMTPNTTSEVPGQTNNVEQRFDITTTMSTTRAVERLERLSIHEGEEEESLPSSPEPESRQARPCTPRNSTDPLLHDKFPQSADSLGPLQPRNRSPYSRASHVRAHSSSSPLGAPPMLRAHSSPTYLSATPQFTLPATARSTSPLRSPKRVRSPFRMSEESSSPYTSALGLGDIESISEDSELDLTPRAAALQGSPLLPAMHNNTFPRRRRPASPLHQMSITSFPNAKTSTPNSSPALSATKFNEAFPPDIPYARSFSSSSVPSTPTSARSRSPSISSLETIPDTPAAEEEAAEAYKLERLKLAAKAADSPGEPVRRSSLDVPGARSGFGARDKRKRWSVCGAERRGDLDLETVWEE